MAPTGGYVEWDHLVLRLESQVYNFYLGGRWYTGRVPLGIQRGASPGATVLFAHAGTAKIHLPYLGTALATSQLRAYRFSFEWLADDQADWYALQAASISGQVLDFCPLLWQVDEFAPYASGSAYVLSRRAARSVIAQITSVTHPDELALDGTVGSHGTISGQTLTASASGNVLVARYMPVYRVVVGKFDDSIAQHNEMRAAVELVEAPSR